MNEISRPDCFECPYCHYVGDASDWHDECYEELTECPNCEKAFKLSISVSWDYTTYPMHVEECSCLTQLGHVQVKNEVIYCAYCKKELNYE